MKLFENKSFMQGKEDLPLDYIIHSNTYQDTIDEEKKKSANSLTVVPLTEM